jgi:hypothetical protein
MTLSVDWPSFAANMIEGDKEWAGVVYERWVTAISAALIAICKDSSDYKEAIAEAASSVLIVGVPTTDGNGDRYQLSFENKVLIVKFDCYCSMRSESDTQSDFEKILGKIL